MPKNTPRCKVYIYMRMWTGLMFSHIYVRVNYCQQWQKKEKKHDKFESRWHCKVSTKQYKRMCGMGIMDRIGMGKCWKNLQLRTEFANVDIDGGDWEEIFTNGPFSAFFNDFEIFIWPFLNILHRLWWGHFSSEWDYGAWPLAFPFTDWDGVVK